MICLRVTTTNRSVKISINPDELQVIVDRLGFRSIAEMVNNGLEEMLSFISEELKIQRGIDLEEMTGDAEGISIMIINEIMLIEIPRNDPDSDGNVADRPEERFRDFLEHLKDAIVYEIAKSAGMLPDSESGEAEKKEILSLYPMESVGKALTAAEHVGSGRLIRWNGKIYIQTSEVSPWLLEHSEQQKSPVGMQPEVIYVFRKQQDEE